MSRQSDVETVRTIARNLIMQRFERAGRTGDRVVAYDIQDCVTRANSVVIYPLTDDELMGMTIGFTRAFLDA